MKRVFRNLAMVASVATLLLLINSLGLATVLLNQNYDSDTTGTTAGWTNVNPYTPSVVNTHYVSASHSLNFHNPTLYGYANSYKTFTGTSENPSAIRISFDIKWVADTTTPRNVWGWKFQAGSGVSQGSLQDIAARIYGGHMTWNGGPGIGFYAWNSSTSSLNSILTFSGDYNAIPGNWFHVEILLHYGGTSNPTNRTFDVTITRSSDNTRGVLTGVPFDQSTATTPDQIGAVWLDNVQTGGGMDDNYLDNLKVETVNSIFEESFDSDLLGSNPSWLSVYSTDYIRSVAGTQYYSSPYSLNLNNSTLYGNAVAYKTFGGTDENPSGIRISYNMKWVVDPNRNVWGWKFIAGSGVVSGSLQDAAVQLYGGHMTWSGGPGIGFYAWNSSTSSMTAFPNLTFPGNYDAIPGNWFHVDAVLHYPAKTADVTITQLTGGTATGTLTGIPFVTTTATTPDQIKCTWVDNVSSGGGADNLYLDDLQVIPLTKATGNATMENYIWP